MYTKIDLSAVNYEQIRTYFFFESTSLRTIFFLENSVWSQILSLNSKIERNISIPVVINGFNSLFILLSVIDKLHRRWRRCHRIGEKE